MPGCRMVNDGTLRGGMLYRFDGYEVDTARFELRKDGVAQSMEPQVFEVLAYMVANHDRIVTKDELLDHVWPERYIGEGVLNTRMMAARKAIGDNGQDQRLIRTIHGRGFRFVGEVENVEETGAVALSASASEEASPPPVPPIRYASTSDGLSIAYAVTGNGPPLVRVLGWFTHLEVEWGWPKARRLWQRLSEHHSLVRYDGRGMGLSDPTKDFSQEARLRDVEAVVDALGAEKVTLLGMSRGAQDAVHYAARHPERVERLIAYGGGPEPPDPEERAQWSKQAELRMEIVRQGWGTDTPAYRVLFTHLFLGMNAEPDDIEYFTEMQRVSTTPERAYEYSKHTYPVGLEEAARNVKAPTLVLHRREDRLVPMSRSRRLAALIPGALFRVLEGENHWLVFDDPGAPEFVQAIEEFTGKS
ncbi:MAG TPA: alpha/beta fold hydrolase [Tepidiformaceae bacterium]|nr:alpha/beta fold hydrolase [Tepidiformaceae bacterium]